MIGCGSDPPQDVAHLQFRSRIAFKLVWLVIMKLSDNNFLCLCAEFKYLFMLIFYLLIYMVELLGTRVPPAFDSFVLVDDSGTLLAQVTTSLSLKSYFVSLQDVLSHKNSVEICCTFTPNILFWCTLKGLGSS